MEGEREKEGGGSEHDRVKKERMKEEAERVRKAR